MSLLKNMRLVSCSLLALAGAAGGVQAAPLVLDNTPAPDVARLLSDKYGVNIVFKGDFGPPRLVNLSLSDADATGARLEAINSLANAVGADFTKTYVISRVGADQDVPVARVDTNAPVVFPRLTMSAQEAISAVAAVDSATAQFPAGLSGNVTLTATRLSAESAAQQIAAQTHTRWKVFYAMLPRTNGRQTGGRVIDRTNGGSAITELPFVYYQHIPTPAERQAQQQADAAQGDPQGGSPGYGDPFYGDPSGGYDYGNPYGYGDGSGYGGGGFDNGGGYVDNGNGLIVGTGGGFGNGFGGGGPIIFQSPGY